MSQKQEVLIQLCGKMVFVKGKLEDKEQLEQEYMNKPKEAAKKWRAENKDIVKLMKWIMERGKQGQRKRVNRNTNKKKHCVSVGKW